MSELTDVTKVQEEGFSGHQVTRFIDREAGMVLYESHMNSGGGLTAIPISETNLR